MRAPHVLVAGACLGQPMGGVVRHNHEILPRVARLLDAGGGALTVLEGREPASFPLPPPIARRPSGVPFQPAMRRAAKETRAILRALDELRSEGRPVDLVHTAHFPAPRALPVPMSLTIHDLRSLDFERAPFVRRFIGGRVIGGAVASAARIGVVSEAMAERVGLEFPDAAERVRLIGNGTDHLEPLPRDPAEPPFLLCVGHIEERKNLGALARALAQDPELPGLVIVGRGKGAARVELERLAADLGVQHRIDIREDVDDDALAALHAGAACAVFPSLLEGHGIGPAEALAAGCPVAASDIPAHREVVGRSAELFDPRAPDRIPAAIRRAMSDGRRHVPAGGASWDLCAERFCAMLTEASARDS